MYFLKESTKDVGHFDSTHPLTTFVPDSYFLFNYLAQRSASLRYATNAAAKICL